MSDQFDVAVHDEEALAEIEMLANLIVATSEHEGRLPEDRIDEILGVSQADDAERADAARADAERPDAERADSGPERAEPAEAQPSQAQPSQAQPTDVEVPDPS